MGEGAARCQPAARGGRHRFFFFFLDLAAAASSWGERERYARGGEKTRERLGLGGRGPPLGWAGLVRFPSKHKKKKAGLLGERAALRFPTIWIRTKNKIR